MWQKGTVNTKEGEAVTPYDYGNLGLLTSRDGCLQKSSKATITALCEHYGRAKAWGFSSFCETRPS